MNDQVELERQEGLRQALTFMLGAETYGVDILRVQEIRGWSSVTQVPNAPPSVLGVLNLRGEIVPVVDLRRAFGLAKAEFSALTVIIVISVRAAAAHSRNIGLVVDSVSEVVSAKESDLRPAPEWGTGDASFLMGFLTLAEGLVQWLDVDRLIASTLSGFPLTPICPDQPVTAVA